MSAGRRSYGDGEAPPVGGPRLAAGAFGSLRLKKDMMIQLTEGDRGMGEITKTGGGAWRRNQIRHDFAGGYGYMLCYAMCV